MAQRIKRVRVLLLAEIVMALGSSAAPKPAPLIV